jgi:hypothetical protein
MLSCVLGELGLADAEACPLERDVAVDHVVRVFG